MKIAKFLVDDIDVEVCGFLEVRNKNLNLFINNIGIKLETRGTCQHTKYTPYIFHTHNIGLLSYPSPEDIYTMMKFHSNNFENDFPLISIVFTEWGIWEISFPHKKFTLDENWLKYLHEVTDTPFHHITIEKIPEVIKHVVKTINKERAFGNRFQLFFTKWPKIGSYKLKTI